MDGRKIRFWKRFSVYAIYLVMTEFVLLAVLFITGLLENMIDPDNDFLFALMDNLKIATGLIAMVILPIMALIFSWIGFRFANRNRAIAALVLALIGIIPLVVTVFLAVIFQIGLREIG